jgi:hypothetical protein
MTFRAKSQQRRPITVDILLFFSPETGESAQLRFALKYFGRISSDLGEFRPFCSRRICCFGEISPKSKQIRPKFWGRNLTARIRPFRARKIFTVMDQAVNWFKWKKISNLDDVGRYLCVISQCLLPEEQLMIPNIHKSVLAMCTVGIFRANRANPRSWGSPSKISGDFFPSWANFVHCSAEEFADLGKFRPNRKKFARHFWGET